MKSHAGVSADVQTDAVVVALVEEGGVHSPAHWPSLLAPSHPLQQGLKAALLLRGK